MRSRASRLAICFGHLGTRKGDISDDSKRDCGCTSVLSPSVAVVRDGLLLAAYVTAGTGGRQEESGRGAARGEGLRFSVLDRDRVCLAGTDDRLPAQPPHGQTAGHEQEGF